MPAMKRKPFDIDYRTKCNGIIGTASQDGRTRIETTAKIKKVKRYITNRDREKDGYKGAPYNYMCLTLSEVRKLKHMRKTMTRHKKFTSYYKITEAQRKTILAGRNKRQPKTPYKISKIETDRLFDSDYTKQVK